MSTSSLRENLAFTPLPLAPCIATNYGIDMRGIHEQCPDVGDCGFGQLQVISQTGCAEEGASPLPVLDDCTSSANL